MGPSTQQAYGSYDYELSIQIAGSDRALFTAMILSITLDNQGSIVDLEDLKLQCHEWDVAFVESERAVS